MDHEMQETSSTSFSAPAPRKKKGVPLRILKWYLRNLDQNPVLTKALTSGAIAAFSDATSQLIVQVGKDGVKHYSWRSTAAFAAFRFFIFVVNCHVIVGGTLAPRFFSLQPDSLPVGVAGNATYDCPKWFVTEDCSMVVTGPVTHYIYQFLEVAVAKKSSYSSVKKAILDRLMFAPPYLLALFYFVARMEGKSHQQAWEQVKAVYWPALFKNLIIWGAAQFINMRYVPIKYRVLFGNVVALIWNMYLALIRR